MNEKEIGERIKMRRESLNMSAVDLAAMVNLNKSTIHHYENGDFKKIKLPVIESIAYALRVSPAWIIGTSNDMTPPSVIRTLDNPKEILDIVDMITMLLNQNELTLDGMPAPPESVQAITDALTVGLEMARLRLTK